MEPKGNHVLNAPYADRSLSPILILGLIQADLYLISDEILSLSLYYLYISFIFLVRLSYYLYLSSWFILRVVKLVEVLLLMFIVVNYQ
jgi:hypothetical protein